MKKTTSEKLQHTHISDSTVPQRARKTLNSKLVYHHHRSGKKAMCVNTTQTGTPKAEVGGYIQHDSVLLFLTF